MSWLWVGPWQWTATPPAVKETTTLAGLTSLLAALKRFEPKNAARNGLRRAPEMLQAAFGTPNHKPLLGALILVMQRTIPLPFFAKTPEYSQILNFARSLCVQV